MTCQRTMPSGNICGEPAITFANNIWCCERHTTFEPETLIYKYPENTLLSDLPNSLPEEWKFDSNYINFKVKYLLTENDLPLVMMDDNINATTLAHFLLENIQYLDTQMTDYKLKKHYYEYYIDKITHDNIMGIFYVYLH